MTSAKIPTDQQPQEFLSSFINAQSELAHCKSDQAVLDAINKAIVTTGMTGTLFVSDNNQFTPYKFTPTSPEVLASDFLSRNDIESLLMGQKKILITNKFEGINQRVLTLAQGNEETKSIVLIPVFKKGTIRAIIVFTTKDQSRPNESDYAAFVSLSETASAFLDNIFDITTLNSRVRDLETITLLSKNLTTTNDLQVLFNVIHDHVIQRIGQVDFLIALYDKENNTIQIPFIYESNKVSNLDSFPMGEGLTSILIRTRQPLMLVEDTERRSKALGAKLVGKPAKSWMGVPLIVAGDAIGALVVQDTEKDHRFTDDDLEFMVALGAHIAGPIYNIRLLDQARQRAVQLQTAAEIARDTGSSLVLDELLQKSVNLIRNRFGYYHAAVFIVDPSGTYAVVREATGDAGAQMKRAGHRLEIGGKSIIGYTTSTGQALVVNDAQKDPTYYPNPLLPETRAEVGIPLKAGNRILGALDVQSTSPYSFLEEKVKILQILADQIAASIINSELFAETQEHLSQHRLLHHVTSAAASSSTLEEALNSAVQGLQVTLGGDLISILLLDHENDVLEVKSSIGYSQEEIKNTRIAVGAGITGWAAQHRKPLRIDDVTKDPRYIGINSRTRSEVAIPLLFRNELLGVLNVESPRIAAYSEKDEELLGTLGGSLSAIIANARLLERVRLQVERDQLVYEITNRIRRSPNVQSVLETTVNEISKAVGARRGVINIDLESS